MKVKAVARHGDLMICKISEIPNDAKKVETNVLAYGEVTGHKHQLLGQVQMFEHNGQKFFELEQNTDLVHEEHKPIKISKGKYQVINEREFDPFAEEIQKVLD